MRASPAVPILAFLLAGLFAAAAPGSATRSPRLRVVSGLTPTGEATAEWRAILRRRLSDSAYAAVADLRKPLTAAELAWSDLIRSRLAAWEREIPPLAVPFAPVPPPPAVTIVLGNRGAHDAFTHDSVTIGHDLSALQREYGDASDPGNRERIDRFFRHEFTHLMQKAWRPTHPYAMDTPLRLALAEMWAEGLGNYYSLAGSWRSVDGVPSERTTNTLAILEPRVVARLAALACATPERARVLTADLSWGRFDRKWGAVAPALWLELEAGRPDSAFRRLVMEGPDGIWSLAERHLSPDLGATLREARVADSLCAGR
jgi:hypothetical protein